MTASAVSPCSRWSHGPPNCLHVIVFVRSPPSLRAVLASLLRVLCLVLNEPEDVAVGVDDGGHHTGAAFFVRRVIDRRTGRGHLGELRFDVVDVPVRDRRAGLSGLGSNRRAPLATPAPPAPTTRVG